MKKVLCLLLVVISLLLLTACERNSTDIAVYERYAATDPILPSLDELGEYTSVQSLHHHASELIFFWDAYHLIVSYDEAQYEQAKTTIEERYTFREKMIGSARETGRGGDDWELVDYPPYCELNGYYLRIIDADGHGFPKDVYLIGINDSAHKIAYVRFYDIDLDSAESLESFLLYECGWSVLIKKNML